VFSLLPLGWALLTLLLDETIAIREIVFQKLNVACVPVFRFVVHFERLEILLNRMEKITNNETNENLYDVARD